MFKTKIGFIPSNWEDWNGNAFTGRWAGQMRDRCVAVLENTPGIDLVVPSKELTNEGLVSDINDAKKVLELFKKEDIQGLIIGNMDFGMEVAVGTILNGLRRDMPILHFATKSGPISPEGNRSTDTWCGQFMTTSAIKRRGFKFVHINTCLPEDEYFKEKVEIFSRAINAIARFKGAKFGQIGTRPQIFESEFYSEQNMQKQFGQMVVPMDLDTAFTRLDAISPDDPRVKAIVDEIKGQCVISDVHTEQSIINQARYELSLELIKEELDVDALAANCWTRIQARYGISACSTYGRLNNKGIITACEGDLMGAMSMLAMNAAGLGETPSDFIDWTDLHPTEENVWLAWHCGNAAQSLCAEGCQIKLVRNERMIQWNPQCHGAMEFMMKPGPVTCSRMVEYDGEFAMFAGVGEILNIGPYIRGAYGWVKVADVFDWENKMIDVGVVHHGALIHDAKVADALELFCKFLNIRYVRGK